MKKNPNQAAPAAGFYMIIKNIEFIYHEYRYVLKFKELRCYKYVARRRRHLEMEIILQYKKNVEANGHKVFRMIK